MDLSPLLDIMHYEMSSASLWLAFSLSQWCPWINRFSFTLSLVNSISLTSLPLHEDGVSLANLRALCLG